MPDTTYRIQMIGGTAPVQGPAPAAPSPTGPAPPAVPENVEDNTEAALDRLVDAERSDPESPDLLTESAPKE